MNIKQLTLLLIILLSSSVVYAQFPGGYGGSKKKSIKGKITGQLIDSITNNVVEFATIEIRKAGKSKSVNGVLSDAKGKFKLGYVKNGEYDLYISFLGYEDKVLKNVAVTLKKPTKNIGKILMIPSSEVLGEVEITEKRALIENKVDRIVFNAEDDSSISGGDAADVLRKVPLLAVDLEGNVTLRGSSQVKILINGKPSGMFSSNVADALKMFPADQIKKVEVITSPGAKYDGEGSAGIINIITKSKEINGIAGSINASVGTRQNNANLSLNAGRGRFGFSSNGGLFLSLPNDATTNFSRIAQTPLGPNTYTQSGINETSRLGFNGNASAFYDFNAYNSFNTGITGRGHTFDNQAETTAMINNPHIMFTDNFLRNSDASSLNSGYDWNSDYTKKFEDDDVKEFVLAYQYSRSDQNKDSEIKEIHDFSQFNRNENQINDSKNVEYTLQTDYTHPLANSKKLEIGAKGVKRRIDSDYMYEVFDTLSNNYLIDDTRTNLFNYNQDVLAGYASLNFVIKKLSFITGLRYEYTGIDGNLKDGSSKFDNSYDNWLPSFTVSKSLKNYRTLKFSYSQRIQRPSLYYINPFTNSTDLENITVGNPLLNPELTHQFEIGYNMTVLGVSLFGSTYYKKTLDIIEQVSTLEANGIVTVNTYDNVGENNSVGINLFSTKSAGKFTIRGGGDVFTYNAKGVVNGKSLLSNSLNYRIFTGGDYSFTGTFKADFFGFFMSPRRTLQGDLPSFWMYGIGLRKEFKKASLGIRIIDPFNESKIFRTDIQGSDFTTKSEFSLPFRSFGINFRYKFGKVDFKERRSKIKNTDTKSEGGDGGSSGGQGGGMMGGKK